TFTFRGGNLASEIKMPRTLKGLPGLLHPEFGALDLQSVRKPGFAGPRVAMGSYPEVLHQADPKQGQGQSVTPPVTINGRLERREELHRFQFPVKEGQRWRFKVEAESLGSYLDGVLKVTDQDGKQLATADDSDLPPTGPGQPPTKSADPFLEFSVPKGVTKL